MIIIETREKARTNRQKRIEAFLHLSGIEGSGGGSTAHS